MGKLVSHVKRVVLPSFVYTYRSSLPSPTYIKRVAGKVGALGARVTLKKADSVSFHVQSSSIFGTLSCGKLLITIRDLGSGEYALSIDFTTQRSIFYAVFLVLSSLILVNVVVTGEVIRMMAIPFVLLGGHIYFWGMIPSKIRKIKSYLRTLEDE